MKAFVEYVVKALVDFPDEVNVREAEGIRVTVYELRLNKSDIGKVIGKQGRTIQSLRTLVNNASSKVGKRAVVEIIEDKPYVKPSQESSPPQESSSQQPEAAPSES